MKYFSIKELCKSDTATKLGINNTPTKEVEANLKVLVEEVLDPLREKIGKPINVSGAYRCEQVNKEVGGAKNSYHMKGCAADIFCKDVKDTKKLFELAKEMNKYTELIYEVGTRSQWVHIAWDPSSNKHYLNDKNFTK